MLYPKVRAGLLAGCACFITVSARAETLIQIIPVAPRSIFVDVLSPTTQPESIVSFFEKFELSLGTLTQVKFDFDYDFVLTLDLPAAGGGGSGSAGGPIFIEGENPTGGGNGTGGAGAPNTSLVLPFSVTGTYQTDTNLSPFIALFPGQTGTFDFGSTVSAFPDAGVAASMDLMNTSSVTVTYTYTPVPEPGSAALLALGAAGGLAAWRRRRV